MIQKHLIKFVSDAEKKFKDMDIKTLEKFFMRLEMGLLRKTIQYMIRQFKEEKNKKEKKEYLDVLSVAIPIYNKHSAVDEELFLKFEKLNPDFT